MLSAVEIDKLRGYAYRAYDSELWFCRGDTLEDFQQSFLLCALEHEGKDGAYCMQVLKSQRRSYPDAVPYDVACMPQFSSFVSEDGDNYEDWGEPFAVYDEYFPARSLIGCIAWHLYPENVKGRKLFLDYLFGMSVGSGKARGIREMLFRHRLEIIAFLWKRGYLSLREYARFKRIAEEMTEPAKVKRTYSMTSDAIACREYYETHKAYFSEKAKRYNARKKAVQSG